MTDPDAWEEAMTDARRTLQGHLDTIDELNRHVFNVLRLNAVIIAILAAVVYRSTLSTLDFGFVLIGGIGIATASFICFGLLRSGPVSIGVQPSIYEDLSRFDVSVDQYYEHVTGVIYPRAIRDARGQSDRYSTRLNWIYGTMILSVTVLGIGALYVYFCPC